MAYVKIGGGAAGAGVDANDAAEVHELGHTPLLEAAQRGFPSICTALAAAGEGLEEPPVAWDALWAKEASHKHHEVRCRGLGVGSECAAGAVP